MSSEMILRQQLVHQTERTIQVLEQHVQHLTRQINMQMGAWIVVIVVFFGLILWDERFVFVMLIVIVPIFPIAYAARIRPIQQERDNQVETLKQAQARLVRLRRNIAELEESEDIQEESKQKAAYQPFPTLAVTNDGISESVSDLINIARRLLDQNEIDESEYAALMRLVLFKED